MEASDRAHAAEHERALQKISQALELLREARAELQSWAPPSAVNDLEAAESVLQALPSRLPERK